MKAGIDSAPCRLARLMLATRKVSSTSSWSARLRPGIESRPRPSPARPATFRSSTPKNELQAVVEPALLVLRPAHACRASGPGTGCRRGAASTVAIGLLGAGVVLRREQQLAAAELRLARVARRRIVLDQPVERLQRRLEVAALLVGARHLVEHAVVVRDRLRDRSSGSPGSARSPPCSRARRAAPLRVGAGACVSALSISRSPIRRIASERCGAAGAMSRNLR